MNLRQLAPAVLLSVLVPAVALPQALTSLSSVRVGYSTRKNQVKPQGDLKAQIDALDAQIAEAARLGKNGELRRLYAKGVALLNGRQWTDEADFAASLVVRTSTVVADSTKPLSFRLEQIYAPAINLDHPLAAQAVLRKRPAPQAPGAPPAAPPELVKDLGTFDGVSRDLRESPFAFEVDVHDVADGGYLITVDVLNDSKPLGSATLNLALRKGVDATVAQLDSAAQKAPPAVRAEILFAGDRMRNVNRGRLELRTFDPDRDFAAAESTAVAAASGRDPFTGRTGDLKRHYLLEPANEILPYRMYVPSTYNGSSRAFPLILALHGLGGTEDAFFDGYERKLPPLAEQHGYIVAAPLGYRVDGFYGWGLGAAPVDPAARRVQELSEQDVMQVLQQVRRNYKIDENRIYLMGHSMGGIGTWRVAARYPDVWAALAPISGLGAPDTLERIRHVPEIVVHGDDDATVNVSGSRIMVAKLKELGTEVKYIEVPGGSHSGVVAPNLAAVIEFFDAHRKTVKPTSQP